MKRTPLEAIAPRECEGAERSAQQLLHEIFVRGTPEQIGAITHTIGIFIEVIQAGPDPEPGTVIDIRGGKTGRPAHPVRRGRSFREAEAA